MSEDTEIKKEELQEMARAILSEIYGAESAQNGLESLEFSPKVSRGGFGFADGEFWSDGNRRLPYEQAHDLKRRNAEAAVSDEFSPRFKRSDFFEQRVFRRKARENAAGALGENAKGTVENAAVRLGSVPQADLPEKLSDIFCRDARRYDGALEKY
ncbi:MAG: hypothetical protein CVU91_08800 [Firmicutes bacterium HGW-Firmicutes-16]|nr:MAG: hypothetical protein CVU91_08800 [Firmicutes bacterium HGW-Firmicutes-16]